MPSGVDPVGDRPARQRRLLLLGAGIALIIGAIILAWPHEIDAPTAARLADRLHLQYARGTGNSMRSFAPREDARWADGWEFRWRYRPCPERASLRIWISRDGRQATYAEVPDCDPARDAERRVLTV